MSSWTVTIFGACTRHAYKPLFENLPAWRLRGGKFRVFSAFFGENHWNRAPIAVKLRRERKPPRRRRFTQFRRRPRRRTFRSQEASPGAARWAPAPWSWRAVRGALAGATPAPVFGCPAGCPGGRGALVGALGPVFWQAVTRVRLGSWPWSCPVRVPPRVGDPGPARSWEAG